MAALEPHHVDALVTRLESAYYIPVDRLGSAVAARSSCNFIHLATMFKIDVFVSKGRPFDREAAGRAREARVVPPRRGDFRTPVVGRVGILRVTGEADRTYLGRWAASLGVEDRLERALADAAR